MAAGVPHHSALLFVPFFPPQIPTNIKTSIKTKSTGTKTIRKTKSVKSPSTLTGKLPLLYLFTAVCRSVHAHSSSPYTSGVTIGYRTGFYGVSSKS